MLANTKEKKPDKFWFKEVDYAQRIAQNTLEKKTCCAVVMKDNKAIGVVSEKDAANSLSFGHNIAKVTLDKIMSSPVISVQDKDSIAQAIITLRRHRIHRVIAYNSVGQISGILALDGLVRNIEKILH
ncbi:MAG: CBS domain-containing protein [Desulfopila sp.]